MKFRYDVFVAQTQHFACNFETAANIQVGDELDFVDKHEQQYRGKVVERRFCGIYSSDHSRDEISVVQITIEQEQPT